jgi:hypothetical protein
MSWPFAAFIRELVLPIFSARFRRPRAVIGRNHAVWLV